jgi:hypothetical protein
MVIATGVNKRLVFKKQSALGTIATTGSAQYLRRTQSSLDKNKATYQSSEIRPSQQVADMRHGVVSVAGNISGELSVGSYQSFVESMLRQLAQTASTTGAIATVAAATTSGALGTFTRSSGSFITDGFRIGKVVRWTGWTTTATTNNSTNMLIIALTATVMTVARLDGVAVATKVLGDSVTCLEVGKTTQAASASHTRDYYSIEHYFSDIQESEVFTDCVVSQMDIKLPATGLATVDFGIMGLNATMTNTATGYFLTPTAATSGSALAAASGVLYIAGAAVGLVTGLDISVSGGHTTIGGVVGSNAEPDVFPGSITVSGNATVLLQNATFRDYFINETEVSIVAAFATGTTATADFMAITMPRVKMGGAAKDDGEKGLVMTMPFTALENPSGAAGTFTGTIAIQDSAYV